MNSKLFIIETPGHGSKPFTMDVYSHIIEGMQSDAIALLDEVLPAEKNGLSQKNDPNLTSTSIVMSGIP